MATKPKRPKLNKLPRRPKATAQLHVWENYHARVKSVQAANRQKVSDYEKSLKKYESDVKKKASLIKKAQGLGRV